MSTKFAKYSFVCSLLICVLYIVFNYQVCYSTVLNIRELFTSGIESIRLYMIFALILNVGVPLISFIVAIYCLVNWLRGISEDKKNKE